MGAVYEVEHTQLGVRSALKTYTLERGHVELLKKKFLAEGKALARLRNPHLVRVFDLNFDERTGLPYFVMDLVLYKDGEPHTLADVETDDLDEELIFKWFGELAEALDYIHEQGIVHRDVKLSNVLLDAEKHVVLSDFGVSRFFGGKIGTEVDAVTTLVSEATTGARLVMGTRGYMAPEVECGKEATPAADAYSLGVMFVHLLTGMWYEPGSSSLKMLTTFNYRWHQVLPRLLAADPTARPDRLADLVDELDPRVRGDAMSRASTVVRTASPSPASGAVRRRQSLLLGALAAAGLALGVVGWLVLRPASAQTPAEDDFREIFGSGGIYEVSR